MSRGRYTICLGVGGGEDLSHVQGYKYCPGGGGGGQGGAINLVLGGGGRGGMMSREGPEG